MCLRPRAVDCGTPFTVSALVCSGNAVGMPMLRWFAWKLFSGK